MADKWKDRALVSIQLVFFLIYLVPIHLFSLTPSRSGYLFVIIGILLLLLAVIYLGAALTPFPTPKTHSQLIRSGPFKWIRHPIYSGIIFMAFGYAWVSGSAWRMLMSVVLLLFFYFKSRYEEQLLIKKFPEYPVYKQQAGRFFPRFFN